MAVSAPEIGVRYAAIADTAIEQAARRMDEVAFPDRTAEEIKKARAKGATPFDGKLDALSHLRDIERVNFLPRRGTEIAIQASTFETAPLSITEAAQALRGLGVERPDLYAHCSPAEGGTHRTALACGRRMKRIRPGGRQPGGPMVGW
jgi:hypothetical protein